jgi:drug/metabolite transporter (DMT)-like permease
MTAHAARRGMLLVASAAVCWSSGGLIARLVATDPWTTNLWRGLFGAAFLAAAIQLGRGPGMVASWRVIGWPGVAIAACLATASTCFLLSLARTSVANTLILMSVGPYVTGLLAWLVLGERLRRRTWITMAVAVTGAVMMVSGSFARGAASGDLLAIAMASAFATATVLMRRHPGVRMTPAAALGAALTSLFALPLASPLAAAPRDVALLALFGVGQFGVGFLLFTAGARLLPAAETALIGMLETVLGPFWVWLVIGESPDRASLAGGGLILAALVAHAALDLARPPAPVVLPPRPSLDPSPEPAVTGRALEEPRHAGPRPAPQRSV